MFHHRQIRRFEESVALRYSLLTFLIAPALAATQLAPNTLTVTATRQVNVMPDQVAFAVFVSAPQTATIDDVVAAVQSLGITAASLTAVYNNNNNNTLNWSFSLAAPISKIPGTIQALVALQQAIPKSNPGWAFSFTAQGSQISDALQKTVTCSNADLISDATAKAQQLAAAAGMTLGAIQSMTDGTGASVLGSTLASFASLALPNFVQFGLATFLNVQPTTCTAVVTFQLFQ